MFIKEPGLYYNRQGDLVKVMSIRDNDLGKAKIIKLSSTRQIPTLIENDEYIFWVKSGAQCYRTITKGTLDNQKYFQSPLDIIKKTRFTETKKTSLDEIL